MQTAEQPAWAHLKDFEELFLRERRLLLVLRLLREFLLDLWGISCLCRCFCKIPVFGVTKSPGTVSYSQKPMTEEKTIVDIIGYLFSKRDDDHEKIWQALPLINKNNIEGSLEQIITLYATPIRVLSDKDSFGCSRPQSCTLTSTKWN